MVRISQFPLNITLTVAAPTVRHVFFDIGDSKEAARLYDRFAEQVLSAEREAEQIEMTMRSNEMPLGMDTLGQLGSPAKNESQVLAMASVFKALLAGLPGGILGSSNLYRALVDICYGRFSEKQLKSTDTCLVGLSAIEAAKIKLITLAILALTDHMQLELVCAVFGLCAVLLHETERKVETRRQRHPQGIQASFLSGLLNLERLGRVMGPLLTESGHEGHRDSFRNVEREIESGQVAVMLIENWRDVSRQLRVWEQGGYPVQRNGRSMTVSGEKEESID